MCARTDAYYRLTCEPGVQLLVHAQINRETSAVITDMLLHFKGMYSDIKSYFRQNKTILTRPLHGMLFLFMPAGHIAMAKSLVAQTK